MNVRVFNVRLCDAHLAQDQQELNNFLDTVKVKKTASEFIYGELNQWSILVYFEQQSDKDNESPKPAVKLPEIHLTSEEYRIFEVLKQWRAQKAQTLGVKQFMVCHNRELMMLAKIKPQTGEELAAIRGFGDQKVARFGKELITLLLQETGNHETLI